MRWTARSALLFLALGLFVLSALNLAGRVPIAGPTPPQAMEARFAAIAGREAVSLGGSIGTAVDFDAMCVDGARFFNNGQDLFEIEALVELILSRPDPPATFFVVVSPVTLSHDNGLPALAATSHRRTTYRFLHGEGRWHPIAGDWRQALLSEAMPAIGHDLRDPWHGALVHLWRDLPPPDPAADADTGSIDPRAVGNEVDIKMAQWSEDAHNIAYNDPSVPGRAAAALRRIAARIETAEARMVIVVPPYIDQLRPRIAASDWARLEQFERLLAELAARGAIVANYWNDRELAAQPRYFRDITHLNAPGARAFSRGLAADLRADQTVPISDCD